MSKRQKLSFFHFEGLPDEIILKIFSLLDIKGVFQCGKVSKRLRAISNDQSLWSKLNLFEREVPYGFIEKAVQNGCEYLNLRCSSVNGSKKSNMPWKLKYLDISQNVPEGVLQNCHSLEKLAVDNVKLMPHDIDQICQNGKTLGILSLGQSILPPICNRTILIQKLFTKCHQLTEVNMVRCLSSAGLRYPHVCALVDNLTPNILKLNLGSQKCIEDDHVNTLVQRCNKITELDLSCTPITKVSVESIIEHLNSLEKLNIDYTNIDVSTLLRLKSIKTLKVLRCFGHSGFGWDLEEDYERIKNLKLQLPHVSINEEYLNIASPTKVSFNTYVDKILAFFDHLPTST